MRVEWDEEKNRSNQRKHKLSFDEAQEIFLSDEDYLEIYEEEHSHDEDRFIAIGQIMKGVVFVIYVEKLYDDREEVIRIISARWAQRSEITKFQSFRSERS